MPGAAQRERKLDVARHNGRPVNDNRIDHGTPELQQRRRALAYA